MFALVDCNCFFVSCERVFQPHLERKPVIVLSSNDGCTISRSNEAKVLGIQMGAPFFKIQHLVKKHNISVFSAHFSLYSSLSSRVMDTLKVFSPVLEVYSIDEAFLDLTRIPHHELFSYGCHIKKIVKQWTGIPVSIGIGPTKTLAKMASDLAKKHPSGCYILSSPEKTATLLHNFPLHDVWGIGGKWARKLVTFGIKTAFDLSRADPFWVRKAFNVILARTALELRGISCLRLEEVSLPKKSMVSSRSFGVPVTSLEILREAVSSYASVLAQRLRKEAQKTSLLSVSLHTNPFDQKGRFYTNTHFVPLSFPSQDNVVLMKAATSALKKIFRANLIYKRVAVMVLNLSPEEQDIPSLFEDRKVEHSLKRRALFKAFDALNHQYGKNSVVFASEGPHKLWHPRSSWRSPSFTHDWKQLPKVS